MDYLPGINYDFEQDDRFLKIGTDTCLLGAYIGDVRGKSVLDIGTGTGALLLYCFAGGAAKLTGVDINGDALLLAEKNLRRYTDDFELINTRIQDFMSERFDVIVCNPPFFDDNVTKRSSKGVSQAMFCDMLSPEELCECLRRLLKDNGTAYIIYSADCIQRLCVCLEKAGLKAECMQFVYRSNAEAARRVLLKLRKGKNTKVQVAKPIITT